MLLLRPGVGPRYRPPASLATLPMPLRGINTDGSAVVTYNAKEAFQNSNLWTYNPVVIDVASSAALTTAVRTSTAGSVVRLTANITMDPIDLRNTDASQAGGALGKLIDPNGFQLVWRTTGPDLTAQTFTQDGTYSNVWNTTLTLSGSAALQRVLRTDILDARGFATPFWKVLTSKADLAAYGAADAFFVSGTALSIALASGASVEAFKANLKGLYTGSAGTSRSLCLGGPLCLAGATPGSIWVDGVQLVSLDAAGRAGYFYLHNVHQTHAVSKGYDGTQCGHYIASNCLIYASQADGANGFATSANTKGIIQTANCIFERNGDTRTFAADGTLQGVSAHGGVDHASFGSQFNLNNGQGVADTCAASKTDTSWLVSCGVTGGQTTSSNYNFGSAAASASRTAYLDTCTSTSAPAAGDLVIATNGTVNTFATTLASVSGGSVTAYNPGSV